MDYKDVANRIFHFYAAQHTSLQAWAFYLFDEGFSDERELRNRAGAIWLGSLYDALDGEARLLPSLQADAKNLGLPKLIHYSDGIGEMCTAIRRFLSNYSMQEQLFLYDFRCQVVHAWGANTFNPKVHIKYVENYIYKRETLSNSDYHSAIRPYFEKGALDHTLFRLLSPIWRREDPFIVGLLNLLFVPGNLGKIRAEIFEGLALQLPPN